jgi:hypothetical protein
MPFYVAIKIYSSLPPEVKCLSHNNKKFKSSLRGVVHQHSFYTDVPLATEPGIFGPLLRVATIRRTTDIRIIKEMPGSVASGTRCTLEERFNYNAAVRYNY